MDDTVVPSVAATAATTAASATVSDEHGDKGTSKIKPVQPDERQQTGTNRSIFAKNINLAKVDHAIPPSPDAVSSFKGFSNCEEVFMQKELDSSNANIPEWLDGKYYII